MDHWLSVDIVVYILLNQKIMYFKYIIIYFRSRIYKAAIYSLFFSLLPYLLYRDLTHTKPVDIFVLDWLEPRKTICIRNYYFTGLRMSGNSLMNMHDRRFTSPTCHPSPPTSHLLAWVDTTNAYVCVKCWWHTFVGYLQIARRNHTLNRATRVYLVLRKCW